MKTGYCCLALALATLGCAKPAPPAPPTPATAPSVSLQETPEPQSLPVAPPTVAAPPPVAPAAAPQNGLRDLVARFIESDGPGWRQNEKAALELEKLAPAVADLLPLLADKVVAVRRGTAFYLLNEFDPAHRDQVAALLVLLEDQDATLRGFGISAVKQMSHADQVAAVPRLIPMLDATRESKADNRASIARLLGTLKADAKPALDALAAAAANDPDAKVRSVSLVSAAQIAEPDQAVPLLVKGLADKDAAVRLVAAARFKSLGTPAEAAVKPLAAALEDSDIRVRDAAGEALDQDRRSGGRCRGREARVGQPRGPQAGFSLPGPARPRRQGRLARRREVPARQQRRSEAAGRGRRPEHQRGLVRWHN